MSPFIPYVNKFQLEEMFLITEVLFSLLDHGCILSNSCWHFFSVKKILVLEEFCREENAALQRIFLIMDIQNSEIYLQ